MLVWRATKNKVDADIDNCSLPKVLKKVAMSTGWHIYYEAGSNAPISVKFKDLPEDQALQRLLGDLNYARSTTNGVTQLLVFHTASTAATVAVSETNDYRIPNELLVKLKRNSRESIEQFAARFNAKILGRNDRALLYRLQFADEASANAAAQALANEPDVAVVSPNYRVDPPNPVQSSPVAATPGGTGGSA